MVILVQDLALLVVVVVDIVHNQLFKTPLLM
jgi:hypothetical protein